MSRDGWLMREKFKTMDEDCCSGELAGQRAIKVNGLENKEGDPLKDMQG